MGFSQLAIYSVFRAEGVPKGEYLYLASSITDLNYVLQVGAVKYLAQRSWELQMQHASLGLQSNTRRIR